MEQARANSASHPQHSEVPVPRSAIRARLFERELDYVYRSLRRHGVPAAHAEDLAQDVFVGVCRRWGELDSSRPLRPWLAGIAFRVATEYHRRSNRRIGDTPGVGDDDTTIDLTPTGDQARNLVLSALERLTPEERAMIVLRELDRVPMREVASLTSVPLVKAYRRLRRAKKSFAGAVKALDSSSGTFPPVVEPAAASAANAPAPPAPAMATATQLLAIERLGPDVPVPDDVRARALARLPETGRAADTLGPSPQPVPGTSLSVPTAAVAAGIGVVFALLILALAGAFKSGRPPGSADPVAGAETSPPVVELGAAPTAARAPAGGGAAPARPRPLPRRLARGLVGYWEFEESADRWAIADSSGKAQHCVLKTGGRGAVDAKGVASGVLGGGLALDGRRWLDCPATTGTAPGAGARQASGELSVAMWVKPVRRGGRETLVARAGGERTRRLYAVRLAGRSIELAGLAGEGTLVRARRPDPGRGWFHVAAVRDGGAASLFIDGVEVGKREPRRWRASAAAASAAASGGTLAIGATPAAARRARGARSEMRPVDRFQGLLDDVRVYDRALRPEEIRTLAGVRKGASVEREAPTAFAQER
jgi:RNA polymerase sigma-70 factor, ECF subfamily